MFGLQFKKATSMSDFAKESDLFGINKIKLMKGTRTHDPLYI